MTGLGNDGDRAGKEVSVEIIGNWVKLNKLFGHGATRDGDGDLAMAITFVGKELGDSLGVSRIGTKTITGFGRIDDKLPTGEGLTS
ncbi:MAG: hypothetical protein UX59_C0015G0008 [Microgenomates group bacterium GW2011_GWA1_46_7]|nr:MAG: hypothetical protein UX59_C0015G0008 [Microgenomates group bacterium GW2011_GWA1_46_7]